MPNSFSNKFGTISDSTVEIINKSQIKSIPISAITSISVKRVRNWVMAIGGFAGSVIIFILFFASSQGNSGAIFMGLIFGTLFFLIGLAYYIGHHKINIKGQGIDVKIKVEMSKTKEGQDFYLALKKVIEK